MVRELSLVQRRNLKYELWLNAFGEKGDLLMKAVLRERMIYGEEEGIGGLDSGVVIFVELRDGVGTLNDHGGHVGHEGSGEEDSTGGGSSTSAAKGGGYDCIRCTL